MSINKKYEFLEATLFYIWLINCFILFFQLLTANNFQTFYYQYMLLQQGAYVFLYLLHLNLLGLNYVLYMLFKL